MALAPPPPVIAVSSNCVLIIVNAVKIALAGEPVGGVGVPHPPQAVEKDKLVRDFRGVTVPLAEEKEAPLRVRTIYEEIQRAAGLPVLNTDYRAMGAYPDWLEVFWNDCKPLMRDKRRSDLCAQIARQGVEAARQLPYPLNIRGEAFPDMVEVNDAFHALLPGLIANVAIARKGLGPEPQA